MSPDEPFEELPSPLIPEHYPVTFYFIAQYNVMRGRRLTQCSATVRIDGYTDSNILDIGYEASELARQYSTEGDSCEGGELVAIALVAPAYFQYSAGF